MLYADDTIIFTAASNIDQLQLNLSLDLNNVPAPYHKKNSTRGWASNEQFNVMYILGHKTNC